MPRKASVREAGRALAKEHAYDGTQAVALPQTLSGLAIAVHCLPAASGARRKKHHDSGI
jgi:hypothetical protein